MTDRLTDEEIAEMRERRKEGVAIIESAIRNDDLDAAWDGKGVLSQLAWEELPRLLDEVERLRVEVKSSQHHCGQCLAKIDNYPEAVGVRTMGAPNPFCSMECAKEWGDQ